MMKKILLPVGITVALAAIAFIAWRQRAKKQAKIFLDALNKGLNPVEAAQEQGGALDLGSQPTGGNLLALDVANQKAKQIKSAWGLFNDDEELVYSVLSSLANKQQLKQVNQAYFKLFQRDIKEELQTSLNEAEFAKAMDIINKKPLQ